MKTLKLSLFGLSCIYIGGCLSHSWTVAFEWTQPFCWPYAISKLWYSIIFNLPPM